MTRAELINLARTWSLYSGPLGEKMCWLYLMQAIMRELHP